MLGLALILSGVFLIACFLLARSHGQQQAVWASWHREVLREREAVEREREGWRQERRELLSELSREREAVESERRELLNRIQRPQLVTPERVEHFELPEPEPDESSAVGTIVWDERYAEQDPDMPMPETVEID